MDPEEATVHQGDILVKRYERSQTQAVHPILLIALL